MTYRIRTAQDEDIPAIVELVNLAYRVEDFFINGNRTHEGEVRELLEDDDFLLAEDEQGRLMACVHVATKGEHGYFGMLSVHPEAQGTGLGRQMIAAAEGRARDCGCEAMDITYVNLREELPPFYSKFGYRETGAIPFPHPWKLTQPAHLVTMSKPLLNEEN